MVHKQQIRHQQLMYVGARVLMALIFLIAGSRKLLAFSATVDYFGHLGLPFPALITTLSIAMEVGGGLALVFGLYLPILAAMLGMFTLATAMIAHQFWAADPAQFSEQLNNFLKNVAMAGGFILLALYARSKE
ncbi:MAG: hypothetical protein RLZZ237_3981 [Pseudomonadota bacterium]|jgi:putative oxidoreductase